MTNTHRNIVDDHIESLSTWKINKFRKILTIVGYFLSLGILFFITLYDNTIILKLYCDKANPEDSDYILITDYNNQFVIGRFNKLKEYGEVAPDRLFMVGNGVDIDHRSNALVLDINGKLTINDVAFGTIDSLADEIARIWAAIGGGGGGGATSLAGLSDVHLTNPINGQALIFDSGSGRWINGDAGGGGGGVEVDIARQMESNMIGDTELPIEIGTMEEQVEEQEESE